MCFENLSPHPFFRGPSPILRGEEVRTSLLVAYCSSILINVDTSFFNSFRYLSAAKILLPMIGTIQKVIAYVSAAGIRKEQVVKREFCEK